MVSKYNTGDKVLMNGEIVRIIAEQDKELTYVVRVPDSVFKDEYWDFYLKEKDIKPALQNAK